MSSESSTSSSSTTTLTREEKPQQSCATSSSHTTTSAGTSISDKHDDNIPSSYSSEMGTCAGTLSSLGGVKTSISLMHSQYPSRKLMVFIDGSVESDRAFYAALQWLRKDDTLSAVYIVDGHTLHPSTAKGISLFNVSSTDSGSASSDAEQQTHKVREQVHRLIARYAGMAREAGVHNVQAVAVATSSGRSVAEEALYYSEQMHADCILTGTRQQGALKRFFLGSFSSYLLNHSKCDVLIIKADIPGRHIVRGEECPIAKAAFEAHRSLHEGSVGDFAGHSTPESTVAPSLTGSTSSKAMNIAASGASLGEKEKMVTTTPSSQSYGTGTTPTAGSSASAMGTAAATAPDKVTHVIGSSGYGAHHSNVDEQGAVVSQAMAHDAAAGINKKLGSLALSDDHTTGASGTATSGTKAVTSSDDRPNVRPPSPH